jgi:uncharacterized protein (TIGR02266 family)
MGTMTQETRKDRRVKIVSLNVRYKSATVDEFIDNHSHDVSRGGIFTKTQSPFVPGTLLKFEIRLAQDQAVISGVGRVVWKREPPIAPERPAGMGVKFIKLDDPSKAVIERLMAAKADAGRAYESEMPMEAGDLEERPEPLVPVIRPAATASSPVRISPSGRPLSGAMVGPRKATILGLGALSSSTSPAAAPASGPMFPAPAPMFPTGPAKESKALVHEQTVMKQASELLDEALREAGGSIEEIGHNPLFDLAKPRAVPDSPSEPKTVIIDDVASVASTPPLPLTPPPERSPVSPEGPSRSKGPAAPIVATAAPPAKRWTGLLVAVVLLALVAGAIVTYAGWAEKRTKGGSSPVPGLSSVPVAPSASEPRP